ncbi:MAG: restriction endonuclease subunit S [Candidatus Woesearchaeota archaeon]
MKNLLFMSNIKTYIALINEYLLDNNFGVKISVNNSLDRLNFRIPSKIQKKDYLIKGKIPIIDQGKSFIAGYTNNEDAKIIHGPFIIFGDHTKSIKYVDFDFAQGADGVKILKPKNIFNARFFYYQLKGLTVEERGYSRHYKYLLKEQIIFCKDKELQLRIVNFLDDFFSESLKTMKYFDQEIEREIIKVHFLSEKLSLISSITQKNTKFVSKLRQAILSEAVEGKLVPQDPNDEPASVLLQKIKKEKELLVKEKKIRKEKPLPLISKEELPYELPKGWEWVRLGDISSYIQRGRSPKYTEISDYPVISQKCVQWNGFYINKVRYIDPQSIHKYEDIRFVISGDLLWNSTGDGTIGRICEYNEKHLYKRVVVDSHVTIVRVVNDLVYNKFVLSWLSSKYVQDNLKVTGSTKQTELGTGTIKNCIVPLPPLEEQKRIVQKIDQLMDVFVQLESRIKENQKNSEALMNTILREAFEVES